MAHAFGAVADNPDLIAACVVGDGEAETGPLATSWHGNKFVNPITDGAVLPILHLNGFKIANPTIFSRMSHEEVECFFRGCGWEPYFVEGDDPMVMHQQMAAVLDRVIREIKRIQREARKTGEAKRPRWPMIVLRTPKGWTGPKEVDGLPVENCWRAHQVPISMGTDTDRHLAQLEAWLRSYKPEELFNPDGTPVELIASFPPTGRRRMGANPHANGGLLLRDLRTPDFRRLRRGRQGPRRRGGAGYVCAGYLRPGRDEAEHGVPQLPHLCPRRDGLQPLAGGVRGDGPPIPGPADPRY